MESSQRTGCKEGKILVRVINLDAFIGDLCGGEESSEFPGIVIVTCWGVLGCVVTVLPTSLKVILRTSLGSVEGRWKRTDLMAFFRVDLGGLECSKALSSRVTFVSVVLVFEGGGATFPPFQVQDR